MASFFHGPILVVVYITTTFLTVSALNVFGPAAPAPISQDVNDPTTTSLPITPPTCNDPCPCSVVGPPGAAGIPGLHGNHGLPGAQGPAGASGTKGDQGHDGRDGNTGPAGPAGASGPNGDNGSNGLDGTNGAAGLKGDKGEQGSAGNQGSKGESGTPYTPPPIVAFVAHRTTTFQVTSGDKVIDFQEMKLNIGDDFSHAYGVFTCRIPGLYYFAFNLYPYQNADYIDVYLEHNGKRRAQLYLTGGTGYSSARVSSSLSTILALDKYDEVLLRARATTDIYGNTAGISTFTGYLLQETTSAFIYNLSSE